VGLTSSAPGDFTVVGDTLFFNAFTQPHARELWALSVVSEPDPGEPQQCEGGCPPTASCAIVEDVFRRADCELELLLSADTCAPDGMPSRLTRLIGKNVARARRLLVRAEAMPKPTRLRKLVRKADRQLENVRRRVRRVAKKGDLAAGCQERVLAAVAARRRLVTDLGR
jgi:hypothetical protein